MLYVMAVFFVEIGKKMDFFKKVVKILLTFGENMVLYRSRLTGRSAVW